MNSSDKIKEVISIFSKMPSIGSKSASKLVYHILKKDSSYIKKLANSIQSLNDIRRCKECNNYCLDDLCDICSDENVQKDKICIVRSTNNIDTVKGFGYKGLFHVLDNLISPIDNIFPKDLFLDNLKSRIEKNSVKEVILTLSPTIEGEATCIHIKDLLKDLDIKITRLSIGIPIGFNLEESDKFTLKKSFENRVKFQDED